MHILMTANAAWNIWNFRRPVVAALMADGHRISALAPTDETTPALRELGCRFLPLDMSVQGVNPLPDLKLLRSLTRVFRDERPDVVLSYTIKNNIFGAMAARSSGVPFLPNVTGIGTAFLSGGLLQAIAERLYRRAFSPLPIIFFQNEDDQGLFIRRGLARPEQARLLPGSGIDLTHYAATDLPSADAAPTFLMIARLLRQKGVVEFVDAARQVKATTPQARFQLLGAAGSRNRTAISADTIRAWVEEGVVEYLGTTDDVRPHIAAAHCVVLPSYREGAPRTLLEAAAMARPLIATDVPGCRSVLDPDVSGFLCEARSAGSLAATLRRFLDLPHAAKVGMGRAGRAKMEHAFDEAIVVRAYREAISALADGR